VINLDKSEHIFTIDTQSAFFSVRYACARQDKFNYWSVSTPINREPWPNTSLKRAWRDNSNDTIYSILPKNELRASGNKATKCIKLTAHLPFYPLELHLLPAGLALASSGKLVVLDTALRSPCLVHLSQCGREVVRHAFSPLVNPVVDLQFSKCRFLGISENNVIVSDLGKNFFLFICSNNLFRFILETEKVNCWYCKIENCLQNHF